MAFGKIIQTLEARIKNNPHSLLFARLADFYLKEGRIDEAIELCKEGLQHNPSYITGNLVLGKAYIANGNYEKAEEELKKVLSYDKQYLSAHKLLGDLMTKLGWENKAILHYRDILKIDPMEEKIRQLVEALSSEDELQREITEQQEIVESWTEELEKALPEKDSESVPEQETSGTLVPEKTEEQDEKKEEEEFFFDFSEIEAENKSQQESSSTFLEEKETAEEKETVKEEETEKTEETPLFFEEDVVPEKYETETSPSAQEKSREEPPKEESESPVSLIEPVQTTEDNKEDLSLLTSEEKSEERTSKDKTSSDGRKKKEKQIVSPTLGEIYAAQGQYAKAIKVYETLLGKKPGEKQYEEKIEELKRKLKESSSQ